MAKFKIEIQETYAKTVEVEADSVAEAFDIVSGMEVEMTLDEYVEESTHLQFVESIV